MKYDDIKQILFSEEFSKLIPDGLILSQPIPEKKEGKNVDNFFVMSKANNIYHPLYKFSISSEEKLLIEFAEYKDVVLEECPSQEGLRFEEYEDYKNLYEIVRKAYFYNEQIDTENLIKYIVCLFKLIPDSLKKYYNDLSTDFFAWVNKQLK